MKLTQVLVFAIAAASSVAQEVPGKVDLPSIAGIRGVANGESSPHVESDVGRVSCGGHYADTCHECGDNYGMCNGQCKWVNDRIGCAPESGATNCGDDLFADTCGECLIMYNQCEGDCTQKRWWPYSCVNN